VANDCGFAQRDREQWWSPAACQVSWVVSMGRTNELGASTPVPLDRELRNLMRNLVGRHDLQVLVDEKLAENAARLGPIFRRELEGIGSPLIQQVRCWASGTQILKRVLRFPRL
jgi:hypothetical protein